VHEVERFRVEVREWLADNLVGEFAGLKGLGGPGREHEAFDERMAWNRHLAAAGLTCLAGPKNTAAEACRSRTGSRSMRNTTALMRRTK
jgi:hypothetical protein